MAEPEIRITPTPNPNAIRIGLSRAVSSGAVTFSSAAQAEADPLARKLFGVAGVAGVFMLKDFVTVTKDPAAEWAAVEPAVARVLREHFND